MSLPGALVGRLFGHGSARCWFANAKPGCKRSEGEVLTSSRTDEGKKDARGEGEKVASLKRRNGRRSRPCAREKAPEGPSDGTAWWGRHRRSVKVEHVRRVSALFRRYNEAP